MNQEYDNNNRGAAWPLEKTLSVNAEVSSRKFHGVLARTNAKSSSAPSHNLFLRAEDNRNEVYCVAIFKSTKGGEKLAGGEFSLLSGESFWVSLFRNKSEHPNSPAIDLSFQPKEQRDDPNEYADPQEDDDVPF